ncbi:Oxidation resistance protein 1 [Cyphellophora attinorum]|uniref:Oxidation resistance protein 1 n=1 Tax=Cyphellophora attinorum TaxID=1664694 RepID=A0A0N0NMN3_9EURO|nr:Oxidation resistance protein 1 [Phialophora attinorum]KPI40409.1 Oxidation resistance protein 1 [Phialophora attinorum]
MATAPPKERPNGDPNNEKDTEPTLMSNPHNPSSAAYLAYPVKHVMSSLYRRMTEPPEIPVNKLLDAPTSSSSPGAWTPPRRTASPYQPPPLTPLSLQHTLSPSAEASLLLSRSLAEEIRLLLPPRLQLLDHWKLAYSLEVHGSSLRSLYNACEEVSLTTQRSGYVLVIKDGNSTGSLFGAYLTDAPTPQKHYFGTGECFLWRASILPSLRSLAATSAPSNGTHSTSQSDKPLSSDLLELAGLPPPPSADTSHATRTTTVRSDAVLVPEEDQRIRFKAFPYSGVNDYTSTASPTISPSAAATGITASGLTIN